MTAFCLLCGYPTGLEACLACRGEIPRCCEECSAAMYVADDDFLCRDCVVAVGPLHEAEALARREYVAQLRRCEDCTMPTEQPGPLCGVCLWQREEQTVA